MTSEEHVDILTTWLRELPPEQAQLVLMKAREGLTFRKIAERTNRKRSTVNDEWDRALAPLRARLSLCGIGP